MRAAGRWGGDCLVNTISTCILLQQLLVPHAAIIPAGMCKT